VSDVPVGDKDEDESSSSSLSSDEESGYAQDPGLAALLKVFGTKESFQCAKLFVRNKFSVARTNKELAGKFLPATFDSCSQMYRMLDILTAEANKVKVHNIMPNPFASGNPMLKVWALDIVEQARQRWSDPAIKEMVDTGPTSPHRDGQPIFHDFSSAKYAHQVSDLLGGARFLPLGLFIDGKAVTRIGKLSIIGVYARIMWTKSEFASNPKSTFRVAWIIKPSAASKASKSTPGFKDLQTEYRVRAMRTILEPILRQQTDGLLMKDPFGEQHQTTVLLAKFFVDNPEFKLWAQVSGCLPRGENMGMSHFPDPQSWETKVSILDGNTQLFPPRSQHQMMKYRAKARDILNSNEVGSKKAHAEYLKAAGMSNSLETVLDSLHAFNVHQDSLDVLHALAEGLFKTVLQDFFATLKSKHGLEALRFVDERAYAFQKWPGMDRNGMVPDGDDNTYTCSAGYIMQSRMRQVLALIANMLPDEYVRPVALLGRFWQIVWRTNGLTSLDLDELQSVFEDFMSSFLEVFGELHPHKGLGFAKMLSLKNASRGIAYWGSTHGTSLSPFEAFHKTAMLGIELTNHQRGKEQYMDQMCAHQQRHMTLEQFDHLYPEQPLRKRPRDCIFSFRACHQVVTLVDLEEQDEGPPTWKYNREYLDLATTMSCGRDVILQLYSKIRQFLGGGVQRDVDDCPGDYLKKIEVHKRAWLVPGELNDKSKSAKERTMVTYVECGHDVAFEQEIDGHHVTWYGRVVLLFNLPAIKQCTTSSMPLAYVQMFKEPRVHGEDYPRHSATNLIELKWESIAGAPNYMVLSLEKALRRVMAVGVSQPTLGPLVECPKHKNAEVEVSAVTNKVGYVHIKMGSNVVESQWAIPRNHHHDGPVSTVLYKVVGATAEWIDVNIAIKGATCCAKRRVVHSRLPNPKKIIGYTVSTQSFLECSDMLYITKR
jgi:hypothetical protein